MLRPFFWAIASLSSALLFLVEMPALAVDSLSGPLVPYEQAVLSSNPNAYWRLNESSGSTAFDSSSVGGLNATYMGGYTLGQPGPINSSTSAAVLFNGTTGHARLNDPGVASPLDMDSVTIEAWINWDGTSGDNMIMNKENAYEIAVQSGTLRTAIYRSGWAWNGAGAITPDEWTHIAVTYDESTSTQIQYINGLVASTNSIGGGAINPDNNNFLDIGRRASGSFFNGLLSEVALYDHVLTPEEINAHFLASFQADILPLTPEPSTYALFAVTGCLLAGWQWRRSRTR